MNREAQVTLPAGSDDHGGDAGVYWRVALKGAPAALELPTDRPRPAGGARRRGRHAFEFHAPLLARIEHVARAHAIEPDLVMATGWAVLLARLGGQSEVVLGTCLPMSGGDCPVPLRVDLGRDPDMGSLFARASTELALGQAHALAAPELQRVLGQPLPSDFHPVYQAVVRVDIAEPWPDVGIAPDLLLDLEITDGGVQACIEYAEEMFDADTIARWAMHYQNLLGSMEGEGVRASALELLDARERDHQLHGLNASARDLGPAALVHGLFERQVERTPRAIALVSGSRRLDYGELNAAANRIAHRLLALGEKPDERVGLCAERGVELIAGMLGILKAGGAYVPLDPSYPADRLAYMVADSRPVAVLTQAVLAGTVHGWLDASDARPAPVLVLDGESADPALATQPDTNPDPAELGLTDAHLAYVIYTSGSTGKPKGVMNQHDGVVNSLRAAQLHLQMGPEDKWLQKTSYSFDVSAWEIFITLMTGATLVMARPGGHRDPDYVSDVVEAEGITLIQFVPSMLQIFLDHADLSRCGSLRLVVSGGEALPLALQKRFHALLPRVELRNVYGPTEAAIYVTHWRCTPADEFVTISEPLANCQLHVLDGRGEPVPPGVVGELFLGGVQVARGYLNREELTAERFIPDPFSSRPGARLYRTGDLARRRADGRLEFLGRNDFQVKVQGHRIELGEIEQRIEQVDGVREAVVVARSDGGGEPRLVAYYTRGAGADVSPQSLRRHLAQALPAYMVPAFLVPMADFPSTANGKLDRAALPAPDAGRDTLEVAFAPAADDREQRICAVFADQLGVAKVGRDDNFFDLGGTSLLALRALAALQREEGRSLPAPLIFGNPTPSALSRAIAAGGEESLEAGRLPSAHRSVAAAADQLSGRGAGTLREPIAIVGMAGRFPGARDVEQFWDNLCQGLDTITSFRDEDLDPSVPAQDRANPNYVRARGVLPDFDRFDAAFFGIQPREAELMDPQQRIFLELCWECMERAGEVPDAATVPVGVFAGTWDSTYFRRHVSAHPDKIARMGEFNVLIGNEKDYIATRVAHKLNLTGPAISVYTACSTGLVAVCQAMDSLRLGHCDMALAGGISIACPPNTGYEYLEGAMFSPDGHTRTFDADAKGTVFNDGAAVVLLKRLSDALADGNPIHAVVLGGAVNNDGGAKASFTAPSVEGQAALVAMAQANAGVSPRSIGYVEAHGTATPIGDPIEVAGLTKAFRRFTPDTGFCRIGSLKSNVGHLITAAGSAGLIKAALALESRSIPPTINFSRTNPSIDFDASPFVVNDRLTPWEEGETPRRAGVSSFGVGGTNAHVVLEQAPERAPSDAAGAPSLLLLSARTPTALASACSRLAEALEGVEPGDPRGNLADVAWTLATGRKAFAHRVAVVATDASDAVEQLRSPVLASAVRRSAPAQALQPVFAFPGQGSQYPRMGAALAADEPAFAAALEACFEAMPEGSGAELRRRLEDPDPQALLPTEWMQPAIFSVEYALARAWMARGVQPAAMIGHSIGEFVAATLAGVFSLPDALRLVRARGALMQAQPAGGMMTVKLSLAAVQECLPADLSVAAENAPTSCVVSGPHEALARFGEHLEKLGVPHRLLQTSHAFHSQMMDAVVQPFRELVASVERHPPRLPILSTARADWLDAETAMSPDYWAEHLRKPVRFASALSRLLADGPRLLLEVGARTTLATLSRQHPDLGNTSSRALSSLGDAEINELASLRQAAGDLWASGVAVDVAAFDRRTRRRKLVLPTYPFERQRFWVDAAPAVQAPEASARISAEQPALAPAAAAAAPQGIGLARKLAGLFSFGSDRRESVTAADATTRVAPPVPVSAPTATLPDEDARAAGLRVDPGLDDFQDARERWLAGLFADLSGAGEVGRDDNFFQLGGDSLAAVQLMRRIEQATGVRLNLLRLAKGTVGSLARELPPMEAAATAGPRPAKTSEGARASG